MWGFLAHPKSVLLCHFLCIGKYLFSLRYFKPFQLFVGATVVTLVFLGFVWAAENQAPIRRFRRNHPSISVLAILLASNLFMSVLGGVAVFLFGIAFPILSETTIHTRIHILTFSKVLKCHFVSAHLCLFFNVR